VTTRGALAVLAAASALSALAGCGGGGAGRNAASGGPPPPGLPAEAEQEPAGSEPTPLGHVAVTIYLPSATGEGLASEDREILATPRPEDQAKQILSDLISGPTTDAALPALPPGTRLRQVYVLGDGTAYVDFSMELMGASWGGSDDEIQTVYAIVNSVALNVPGIVRVGILVEGRPCETLGGHVDLRQPLRADPSLIEEPPIEDAPPGTEPLQDIEPPAGSPQSHIVA